VWDFALSKLYSNSLLSTLNARGGWKTGGSTRENVLFGPSADATATTTSTMVIPNGYGRKQVRDENYPCLSNARHRLTSQPL
jgi:hypothetical protein